MALGDSLSTRKEVESTDKAVAKALGSASKQTVRGKHNSYTARAEIGGSDEYKQWLSVILQFNAPPSCKKSEQASDIFGEACPTTSLPFFIATAYKSEGFPLSLWHMSISPTLGVQTSA